MLKEYDFSNARKNPYAKALKKQITINIDSNTIDYFKEQAEVVGIPYQTLINLYLKELPITVICLCRGSEKKNGLVRFCSGRAFCLQLSHKRCKKDCDVVQ